MIRSFYVSASGLTRRLLKIYFDGINNSFCSKEVKHSVKDISCTIIICIFRFGRKSMLFQQWLKLFPYRFFSDMNVTNIWTIRFVKFPIQKCSKEFIKFDFACVSFSRILKRNRHDSSRMIHTVRTFKISQVFGHTKKVKVFYLEILAFINRYSRKIFVIKIKNLFRIVTSLFCCVCSKIGCWTKFETQEKILVWKSIYSFQNFYWRQIDAGDEMFWWQVSNVHDRFFVLRT